MTIIVEDGTVVANANSYISLVDAQSLADNLGYNTVTLTEDDVIKGMREVHKYSMQFKGTRVNADQSVLADFPRNDVWKYGNLVANDSIPDELKQAQVEAAISINGGTVSFGVDDGKKVASEAVSGAVSISYFDNGSSSSGSQRVEATYQTLQPLLNNSGAMRLIR
jgi:hypothetical protein